MGAVPWAVKGIQSPTLTHGPPGGQNVICCILGSESLGEPGVHLFIH